MKATRQIALLKQEVSRLKRVKKLHSKRRSMAKGRRTRTIVRYASRPRRISRGGVRRGLGGARGLFNKAAAGVGGGQLGGLIGGMVGGPQGKAIGRLGGAWLAGGLMGVVADQAVSLLTGQGSLLSGFLGGGSQSSAGDTL